MNAPCFETASIAYVLHVGVYMQLGGMNGEMVFLYTLIRKIIIPLICCPLRS